MMFLLNKCKIKGIKSVKNEISLVFTNKIITLEDFKKSHVKGIYGSNGAGKSAIVHAFDIYKSVVTNEFPFKDAIFGPFIAELINKSTRCFFIEVTFSFVNDGKPRSYSHSLEISLSESKEAYIRGEKLIALDSRSEPKETIFETKDGEIVVGELIDSLRLERSSSHLRHNSLVFSAIRNESENDENPRFAPILHTYAFSIFLNVSFGSAEDTHEVFDLSSLKELKEGKKSANSLTYKKAPMLISKAGGVGCLWTSESRKHEDYSKLGNRLEAFLKLLKPDIDRVELVSKDDGIFTYYTPKFHYDGYSVDYEFESTGIKKLCKIFLSIHFASQGSVVFVDEMDAGIHDIFFRKLVDYFATYCHCQLVFTTHNIAAMESLKKLRKSIDILTDDGDVVTWTSKGDSSPSAFYEKGALGGTPLNLQAFDFASIFEGEV